MTAVDGGQRASAAGRSPLWAAAVIPVVVAACLPWLDTHLTEIPSFSAIWLAVLVTSDLLTSIFLLGLYRAGGSPRLLTLSWAFLWSAAIGVHYMWALPGVLTLAGGPHDQPDYLQWLWVSRHVVPPVLIAVSLAPWPARWERSHRTRADRRVLAIGAAWVGVALLSTGFALVLRLPWDVLPDIAVPASAGPTTDRLVQVLVLAADLGALAVASTGVVGRRARRGIESWAVVAAVAFAADVVVTMLDVPVYSLGYYLARTLAVAASLFVMLAIQREGSQMRAQATRDARRLEERNLALVEAQKLREHMTAVVSHDLRTPLAGLQGYLEILLDDEQLDAGLVRRMHERSWMLTRRLTLLSEDLLAAATLEHGDLAVATERLDLPAQLADCALVFPDLDLRISCPPGLTVHADPLRLQQILTNLVRNAQKHGAEPVTVTAHSNSRGVTLSVVDAGPGVPAEFLPRLFDRYTRAGGANGGGSGLGLSVVRDLVRAHGGTVRYDLDANGVVLTLPVAPHHADHPHPAAHRERGAVAAAIAAPRGSRGHRRRPPSGPPGVGAPGLGRVPALGLGGRESCAGPVPRTQP